MLGRLPLWFRMASALLAVPFLALSLALAHHSFTSEGLAAYHYTFKDIAIEVACYGGLGFYGLLFIWLASGAPRRGHLAPPQTEAPRSQRLPKLPLWFRMSGALLALPFIAATPVCLLIAASCLGHDGPGGHAGYPYTSGELVIGWAALVLPPVYILLFLWLTLGAPTGWRRAKPKVADPEEAYGCPRCVACRKPIEPDTLFCPKCGWTQPK